MGYENLMQAINSFAVNRIFIPQQDTIVAAQVRNGIAVSKSDMGYHSELILKNLLIQNNDIVISELMLVEACSRSVILPCIHCLQELISLSSDNLNTLIYGPAGLTYRIRDLLQPVQRQNMSIRSSVFIPHDEDEDLDIINRQQKILNDARGSINEAKQKALAKKRGAL